MSHSRLKAIAEEIQAVWADCDAEGRPASVAERREVERLLAEVKTEERRVKSAQRTRDTDAINRLFDTGGRKSMSVDLRPGDGSGNHYFDQLSEGPGDAFVKSEGWKAIADPMSRPQTWTTGAVNVSFGMKAGTLFEGSGGQGAGFVTVPQVAPGVVQKLFEAPSVASVFPTSPTDSPTVRYMIEGTATSGAAGVAEGGTKPASDIAVSTVDEPVKKIATVLTVSDELLEDGAQIQSYMNSRLSLFVRIEEDRQLLRGAGTNELVGVMNSTRGINLYTKLGTDDNATAFARVLANTAGSANLAPDTIIMHPQQWLSTRLLRDGSGGTVGQFLGGGPFTGAYGNGGATDAGLFGSSLWNTQVIVSSVVGAGTALVGCFGQAAHIYRRGGPTVEATNSHASYFQSNLVMIRAESRLAVAVFRPAAFTEVRGLALCQSLARRARCLQRRSSRPGRRAPFAGDARRPSAQLGAGRLAPSPAPRLRGRRGRQPPLLCMDTSTPGYEAAAARVSESSTARGSGLDSRKQANRAASRGSATLLVVLKAPRRVESGSG